VTIIWRKEKNGKETIIVKRKEYILKQLKVVSFY